MLVGDKTTKPHALSALSDWGEWALSTLQRLERRRVYYYCLLLLVKAPFLCADNALWTDQEQAILRSLSLDALPPKPKSPSNRYADNTLAQQFGQQIFFDPRFSGNGKLSCASCHQPERYFTDGLAKAVGLKATGRNTPTVVASAWLRWFYWDGRRDSLWSQALIPFEASNEMGSSRWAVVRHILQDLHLRQDYQEIFGRLPKVLSSLRLSALPDHAGLWGNDTYHKNWQRFKPETQEAINRVYVNIGKALAAYQRTLVLKMTRFDHYVRSLSQIKKASKRGGQALMNTDELAGLRLFIDAKKTQCLQCHNGALLMNNSFHNIGTGNFLGAELDFGRLLGLQAVLLDEFNCLGAYSDVALSVSENKKLLVDDKSKQCPALRFLNKTPHIPLKGAFKTPSLRNLSKTAPYFHDGRFTDLMDVLQYYKQPPLDNGPHELQALELSARELEQLLAFLLTLNELE